jgi:hypothetical protein
VPALLLYSKNVEAFSFEQNHQPLDQPVELARYLPMMSPYQ